MIKKLISQWEAYVGPKDERIVAEENRAYSKLAKSLLAVSIVTMYYSNALRRAASMFNDSAVDSKYMDAFPPHLFLSIGIVISCAIFSSTLTKQGIIANNRFAEVDHCPTNYFAICSGLGAAAILVCCFAVECLAQVQFVGIAGVYWIANLCIGCVMAVIVFVFSLAAMVLDYHHTRKRLDRIEAELDA